MKTELSNIDYPAQVQIWSNHIEAKVSEVFESNLTDFSEKVDKYITQGVEKPYSQAMVETVRAHMKDSKVKCTIENSMRDKYPTADVKETYNHAMYGLVNTVRSKVETI